ncbi:hypothetical protein [Aggregatibacter actinomycetemcomitans]
MAIHDCIRYYNKERIQLKLKKTKLREMLNSILELNVSEFL